MLARRARAIDILRNYRRQADFSGLIRRFPRRPFVARKLDQRDASAPQSLTIRDAGK